MGSKFPGRMVSALIGALACALVVSGPALAAGVRVTIPTGQTSSTELVPGAKVLLRATVVPREWCAVSLSHHGAKTVTSQPRKATGALAEFSWSVPRTVAPGSWRVVVRCSASRSLLLHGRGQSAATTLRTKHQNGRHTGPAAGRISVLFTGASSVPTTTALGSGKGGELLSSVRFAAYRR